MYKKLKKQNGERFAQIVRNFHNGILEIPDVDVILRHAGRDATPLLPYLTSLLFANDDTSDSVPQDPFDLLAQAGYDAFYADTLEKQNSIAKYYKKGELLCTFNDAARHQKYHIVHAVKKDADSIARKDFKGREDRQDAYGTSVISIQILKRGGFISIKNRYNHAVNGCDNTFNSNPDNIIKGLSAALKNHFDVEFVNKDVPLPDGFALMRGRLFKYSLEHNNIYYGDQAWAENGHIHAVDKSVGDALFDRFLFDNKSKTLKKIDPETSDSFADDFNRAYGGNRALTVQKGNLMLDGAVLIGAENSCIKTLHLPALKTMGLRSLYTAPTLTSFTAPSLVSMEDYSLGIVPALQRFAAENLATMGDFCLRHIPALAQCTVSSLASMGQKCMQNSRAMTHFTAPSLTRMGTECFLNADALKGLDVPKLASMEDYCFFSTALKELAAPALKETGDDCFFHSSTLERVTATRLVSMGGGCFHRTPVLAQFTTALATTPPHIRAVLAKNRKARCKTKARQRATDRRKH